MGIFELAAIAIIGGLLVKAYKTWVEANKGSGGSNARIQQLERRIQALEAQQDVKALQERIHVLEEIVTTDEFELQKKFRELESNEP